MFVCVCARVRTCIRMFCTYDWITLMVAGVLQRVWWTEFSKCGVSALAVCEGQGGGGWRVVVVGDDKGGLGSILIHEPDDCGGNGNKEMYFHPTDRGGRKESLASYSSQHGRRVCSLVATAPASSFRRIVSGCLFSLAPVSFFHCYSLVATGPSASFCSILSGCTCPCCIYACHFLNNDMLTR